MEVGTKTKIGEGNLSSEMVHVILTSLVRLCTYLPTSIGAEPTFWGIDGASQVHCGRRPRQNHGPRINFVQDCSCPLLSHLNNRHFIHHQHNYSTVHFVEENGCQDTSGSIWAQELALLQYRCSTCQVRITLNTRS